jgi:hypothetical protein
MKKEVAGLEEGGRRTSKAGRWVGGEGREAEVESDPALLALGVLVERCSGSQRRQGLCCSEEKPRLVCNIAQALAS